MNRFKAGFTLIELMITLIVMVVLVALGAVMVSNQQAQARDTERVNDIAAIKRGLEQFYERNGYYPNAASFGSSVSSDGFAGAGVTRETLTPPGASSPQTTSSTSDTPTSSQYFYKPLRASAACGSNTECFNYELRYREEANAQAVVVVRSQRQ